MKLINLTPHDIVVHTLGNIITFKSEGNCRIDTDEISVGAVTTDDGVTIPIRKTVYGDVEGLPDSQDGVMYIVSAIVAQRVNRDDLIAPDTFKGAIRDAAGKLIGTKNFQTF